jgi:hypothetical protein
VAQQVNVVLVDDLDGNSATETVLFGLDGVSYEIDLNDRNAKKLRDALAGYVAAGRRVGGRQRSAGRTTRSSATSGSTTDTAAVRAWAKSKGYEVSDRGRISAEVLDAYKKANRK